MSGRASGTRGWPLLLLSSVLVLGSGLCGPWAWAETQMVFPRILFQKGRFCGIAIANPTGTDAEITFTAYNADGTRFLEPATLKVPAGSQVSKLAWQILGPPDSIVQGNSPTRVWLEATSASSDLTGFFLEGTDALEHMDGSALSGRGTDLIVPLVEHSAGSTSEISLVNPDESGSANVQVTFLRSDGSTVLSTADISIASRGALQGSLADFFVLDLSVVAALRVRSDLPIVCYLSIYRQPDDSLITVPAQNAALPASVLYFPQLAQGDVWATSIGLTNSASAQILATLTAYQKDGSLFQAPTVSNNPVSVAIPAGGSVRAAVDTLFGFKSMTIQEGWIKAETATAALFGYVEYGAGSNRALVPAQTEGSSSLIFSHQAMRSPYFTGLAVLNAGALTANVEVVSLNADSQVAGKTQRALMPGQRESLLIQQWIPAAAGINGGAVFLKSDSPVITTELFGVDSLSALANVPPQLVSSDFDPGAALPGMKVTPPLAVVETGKTLKFTSSASEAVLWGVNGVAGGNSSLGLVAGGLYSAPVAAPEENTITVSASTTGGELSAGATIDVVQREELTSGLTLVTAVAYVEDLQKFFVAEQQILSSAPGGEQRAASVGTKILEQAVSGSLVSFYEINNETVTKMLPFTDSSKASYLLLAGYDTGSIFRLALLDKQLVTITTGLNKPNSLAFDTLSGNLLVSAEDGLSVIARSQFDPTASSSPRACRSSEAASGSAPWQAIPLPRPQGIASSGCNGSVFVTMANGDLREYRGIRGRILLSGLDDPRQLLVLYRRAPTCAEALTLVITEASRITLYFPFTGKQVTMLEDIQGGYDLTFFPRTKPFGPLSEAAIGIAERRSGSGASRVLRVRAGRIYDNAAPAPPSDLERDAVLRDPPGDTFEGSTTQLNRLASPDIVSIETRVLSGSVIIAITFARPVAPPRLSLPNSLAGYIDLDFTTGGQSSHVAAFNLFSTRADLGVDAYIDLSKELIYWGARFSESAPVVVKYLGEIVAIRFPTASVDPSKTRFAMVVGNRAEMTDVFPNLGSARLVPQ